MTDAAPPQPRLPARIRWLLIGSLTLNLLIIGLVAGMALRFGAGPPQMIAERSLGFGPWSGGLEREDYNALRKGFEAKGQDLRAAARADRAARAALVAALRAEPFDPAALDAIIAEMQQRTLERLELGQTLIRAHVLAMTPAARHAFADRLERSLKRRGDKDRK